jgi:hypothetical protein
VPQGLAQTTFVNQQMGLDPGDEIYEWVRERKYCPSTYNVLMNKCGLSIVIYAALLEPAENSFVVHNRCERRSCVAYNVNVPTYKPRHLSEGRLCEKIRPPVEVVFKAPQSGTLSLLDGEAMLNDEADSRWLSPTNHA